MDIKNIIVLIKQVPNTNEIKIDPKTGTLIREGIPSIMNPDDKHALEEALKIKEQTGATVTVITMGPPQAEKILLEALGMGADKAYHVTDRLFAGADTLATSYTLSSAIKKIGEFDIIFAGREAIDGDTAQVGPQIAEMLGIPQVTYVKSVEIKGKKLKIKRALENGYYEVEVETPVLLTAIKDLNTPRYPNVANIANAFANKSSLITLLGANSLDVDQNRLGLKGSPTQVFKSFSPTIKRQGEILTGNARESASKLKAKLKERHLI
ncbi:MAG TPA: electron transfer flavoprotein subunit beta/FixA family protein [Spirochaetota bacterium]|nr:electron transfer flavoprotein subunit beta/FixA family protein [Spirochaetota bacterium]HOM37781.1 electron transfer flavoprotein subunit beta/FixA family protein [Spirochaetota bacterium]HPQ49342.1 electron transfer flavoprotein subunit beta/FixA family protein [Spirochaetota bacterium]